MADASNFPALLTPPAPGLDINASQVPRILGVAVSLILLSTVCVALRFLSRRVSKAGLWWDDWTILIALFFSWGSPICMIIATHHGFGKHIASEPDFEARLAAATSWFKTFYAYESFYIFGVTFAKISILLFYSRIFKTPRFRLALWITTGLVVGLAVGGELSILTECVPIHALWDFTPGRCIDISRFLIGTGIPNVMLNVIILLLPIPSIWTLQIERTQKLALSAVFMLGSFIVVVSIVRLVVTGEFEQVDITWQFVNAAIWTSVEPSIAVCSACLPIMRSLWIRSRRSETPTPSGTRKSMKSLPSIKSTKAGEKDIGSITSRSQLNELSAENELPWGNHVSIYTTHRRSSGTEDDIQMDDLSIPPNAARVKNQVSWFDEADKKRQHSSQNAAELAA